MINGISSQMNTGKRKLEFVVGDNVMIVDSARQLDNLIGKIGIVVDATTWLHQVLLTTEQRKIFIHKQRLALLY